MKKGFTLNGFTLIELLVVIAIIGVLVALSVFGGQNAFKEARDTQRRSDLKQYQTAMESYANRSNGLYYATEGSTVAADSLCQASILNMQNCPTEPSGDPSYPYRYQSNGLNATPASATSFVLWSLSENPTGFNVVCSNGKSGFLAYLTVSGGTCPF